MQSVSRLPPETGIHIPWQPKAEQQETVASACSLLARKLSGPGKKERTSNPVTTAIASLVGACMWNLWPSGLWIEFYFGTQTMIMHIISMLLFRC